MSVGAELGRAGPYGRSVESDLTGNKELPTPSAMPTHRASSLALV